MEPTHLWVFDRAVIVTSKEKQEHCLKAVGILQKKRGGGRKIDIKCSKLDIFLASDPEGMTLYHLFRQKIRNALSREACKLGRRGNCQKPPPLPGMCCLWWPQGHMALRDLNLIPFFSKCLVALNPLSQFLSNRSVGVSTLGP